MSRVIDDLRLIPLVNSDSEEATPRTILSLNVWKPPCRGCLDIDSSVGFDRAECCIAQNGLAPGSTDLINQPRQMSPCPLVTRHMILLFVQSSKRPFPTLYSSNMADTLCGPSNPLQSFQKHASTDRALQQDRLTSRQLPTEVGFPHLQNNAGKV